MTSPTPKQLDALRRIADGRFYPDLIREDDGWHARWRPDVPWLDEFIRTATVTPLTRDAEDQSHSSLHDAWIAALRSDTGLVRWDDGECERFAATLAAWHHHCDEANGHHRKITFRFDAASGTISCAIPKGREALRALGEAVEQFGPLRAMRREGDRLAVMLERVEAESFLRYGAKSLRDAGYGVEGDDMAVTISAAADITSGDGESKPDGEAKVKLVIKVAGEPVDAAEIKFLLEQGSSLVFFRNRWIEVDRTILKAALRALEKAGLYKLNAAQALAFASGIGRIGKFELEEVAVHGWLRGMLGTLGAAKSAAKCKLAASIPGLNGELREYQRRGAAWMRFLTDNGFGALLADDMGLGKTIQTIAWILTEQSENRKSEDGAKNAVLIVAPLTLLSNWRHELKKFAPSLKTYVHQGSQRLTRTAFRRNAGEVQVVLTSYTLLVKDHLAFGDVAWRAMILDEAQYIKNPDTAVARAVRALTPAKRIALTGTPIENSVSDIWSIEEFLNPGFLGDRKEFSERFVKPLAADPHAVAAQRLKHALEPFVLRRLKSESDIAAELGAKREIREYCQLSPRGRAQYEAALADYLNSKRRRGDIFTLLTRLKLICDGMGKFERLAELLEQIFAAGESALIFTQYAKVGRELKQALDLRFGGDTPFLHGALTATERDNAVERFNRADHPLPFILSLRAGGFGLNLTKATHVIHYDRWWNPAVENQATDRAHRIGQTKTVFVHIMITAGTVEEHVDEIISRKTAVADGLVKSGESFLAQMPAELFEKAVALDE